LLDKSVLVRDARPSVVRYRMLESLRDYGAERLGENGLRRWCDRHLAWTERFVLRAGREWFGPRQATLLHRLRREQPTIAAALDAATDDPARAPQALRMVRALEPWWFVAGRISEARRWLAAVLHHGADAPEQRTPALALAAWFATVQGDLEEAEELLTEVPRTADRGSPSDLAAVARARGALALARGHAEAAHGFFEESVDLAQRAGSPSGAAEGWLLLGLTRHVAGRRDDAEQAVRRCTALADRAGDSQLHASAQALQALGALERHQPARALTLARESLRVKAEVEDWSAVAFLLEVLAWVALADDDPVRTAILVGAAERLWRQVGVVPDDLGPLAVGRRERLAAARQALGRRDFDRHAQRGAAMTWEMVVRYAQDDVLPRQRSAAASPPLTARELAIAELVARGLTNPQIAAALVISVRTVQGHVEHILQKLGFSSRAQVAAWIAKRGVETPP
jgi:non-specific serine/threonine protein kinase